ncbi:TM2 domain-containing protein 2-like [Sycon ciliatum]|uniref:TM2 domain-containing protein 2-like n=1 Tax=Sycon ciliatum TaxID=27933 RepID=UPI0020AB9C0D|eukprot:scpid72917/ scgid11454/ TM2 domain-containing protein 2
MLWFVLSWTLLLGIGGCDGQSVNPCRNETCGREFDPYSPLVLCSALPDKFVECDDVADFTGNTSMAEALGYGCTKFGGTKFEDVQHTKVVCHALPDIECYGDTDFLRGNEPCVKYNGYNFLIAFIFSVLLGFAGADRFYLGYTGHAVGKLLTLGGVGVWWIVDLILLLIGFLTPEDGSNWDRYF